MKTAMPIIDQLLEAEKDKLREVEEVREQIRRLRSEGTSSARPVSAREFLLEDQEPLHWIVENLIAEGSVGLMVAHGGVGKTTLLTQLALCIADGRSVFDFNVPTASPVLYVMAEGSRSAFRDRFGVARKTLGVPLSTLRWFIQPADCTGYTIGGPVLEALIEHSRAKLVILDTLGYFHKGDENSANDWKAHVMTPLRSLVAQYGCTFILVHHQTKASQDRQGWQQGRGTSAMYADVDFWLRLERVEDEEDPKKDRRELWVDKNKYGAMGFCKKLIFHPDSAFFRVE